MYNASYGLEPIIRKNAVLCAISVTSMVFCKKVNKYLIAKIPFQKDSSTGNLSSKKLNNTLSFIYHVSFVYLTYLRQESLI